MATPRTSSRRMASDANPVEQLIGRDKELESIRGFHTLRATGSAALLITGDPGSGRTAILDAACSTDGGLLLRARPQPEETRQPFTALRDLLSPVRVSFADRLPQPLRDAIDAALLFRRASPDPEIGLVAPAVGAAFEILARQRPVLVAIDGVEWLDPDSARALRFAINRLPATVSLALVHGDAHDPVSALAVDRVIPVPRRIVIVARPLSVAGVHHLLSRSLGPVSRSTVIRVAKASGGNPRAALELGQASLDQAAGLDQAGPVPGAVAALVERRLGRLSAEAQDVTRLIAVSGRLSVSELDLVAPSVGVALDEAEAAGAVVEDGEVLRTSSALVATVALAQSTPAAIRAAHARLAAVATAPDSRARHLAALPDAAEHLGDIEAGADFAMRRGAASAAADLFEFAARSTPTGAIADRTRRLRGQARALLAAGDPISARDVAEQAIDTSSVEDRARLIADLADLAWADGSIGTEAARVREALAATSDDAVRFDLMTSLVAFGVATAPLHAIADADRALRLDNAKADAGRRGYLMIHREMASALAGKGIDWRHLRDGMTLEDTALEAGRGPSSPPLVLYTMCDRRAEARTRFAVEDAWYAARGDEGWRAERAGQLALVELRAGHTELAQQLADDAADRLDQYHVGGGWPLVYAWRSLVDAHVGRLSRAHSTVRTLLLDIDPTTLWAAIVRSVAIFVSNAAGDHAAALEHGARMRSILEPIGVSELLADRSEPILADLRIAAGDVDGAELELASLERRHLALPRPWTAMALVRTRAIVLAGKGRHDDALEQASDPAGTDPALPFETAWNQLTRGRLLRRARDKRAAASALGEAKAAFERLGASPWAAQAEAELARVGLRRRPADELTEGELTIARLAGQGMTTRQVADAAFVTVKTVEANLTRIYRKLGIRSRAELGAWVQQQDG
jgi:DNA-binding CsgD family transcriptional regulator